tara:strand:+ start:2318 stop:2494 length:177 start_codon:yes stop_codon:yes gene_type:complete
MAKKEFLCLGGYLSVDGKLAKVEAGSIVEVEEEVGNASRILKAKTEGKKVEVATPKKK